MRIFLLYLIIQLKFLIGLSFLPQVAFQCGRPALYMTSKGWMHDFKQECLQEHQEAEIVKYCQDRYPRFYITNAEPSPKPVRIVNWCDLTSKTCQFDRDVTTYICLDKEFQSDALTLNKNCAFGHVTDKQKCMDYRTLRQKAHDECTNQKKVIDSIGMTFPCAGETGLLMHFYGVEFVCCSKKMDDLPIKRIFIPSNRNTIKKQPIIKSVEQEQIDYEREHDKLTEEMRKRFSEISKEYQRNNKRIMEMEKSEPKQGELDRKRVKDKFIKIYNSFMNQYLQNEVKLFMFHDNRLRFVFLTQLKHLERQFELAVDDDNTELAIKWVKELLNVIHTRQEDLKKEIEHVNKRNYNFKLNLTERYQHLASYAKDMIMKLDKKGEMGAQIKNAIINHKPTLDESHLRTYRFRILMDLSKIMDLTSPSPAGRKIPPMHGKTRRKPDIEIGKPIIHYNMGLDDLDQKNHHQVYSSYIPARRIIWVFTLSGFLLVIILIIMILVLYRTCGQSSGAHRTRVPWKRLVSNSEADLSGKNRKMSDSLKATGFGMYKESVTMDTNENSNDKCHILENPSYLLVGDIVAKDDDLPPTGIHSNI